MKLAVLIYGDPVLRKRSEPITEITDEIKQLASDMIETMDAHHGIGLAANQIGRAIRMFVCRSYIIMTDGRWALAEPKVYINPKLLEHSKETVEDDEGCISVPRIRLVIERPLKVKVEAQGLDGKLFTEELEGYNARIRMHENDHINGVLFVDRVDVHTRNKIEPILRELKKRTKKT